MKKKIFRALVLLWVASAFFGVIYNSFQMVRDFKDWGFLTDTQKREKEFGDKFKFIEFVKNHEEKNKDIILLTNDPMTFFLTRYYFYPTKTYWKKSFLEFNPSTSLNAKSIIASYGIKFIPDNFWITASQSSSLNDSSNYILKIK